MKIRLLLFITAFILLVFISITSVIAQSQIKSMAVVEIADSTFNAAVAFKAAKSRKGNLLFNDDCKRDWQKKWSKDGLQAQVVNNSEGMSVYAGPNFANNADHVVMWTKQIFEGNIIIEYDFTRLDTATRSSVNIIYIQSQGSGKGEYKKDLFEWNDLRQVPAMNLYYDHTDTYHISYAAAGISDPRGDEYIRARRYMPETGQHLKGTALQPEYFNSNLFKTDITYHLTIIKDNKLLLFNVKGDGREETFYFSADAFPPIESGRIGLRQMFTRNSRYANFKVYRLK